MRRASVNDFHKHPKCEQEAGSVRFLTTNPNEIGGHPPEAGAALLVGDAKYDVAIYASIMAFCLLLTLWWAVLGERPVVWLADWYQMIPLIVIGLALHEYLHWLPMPGARPGNDSGFGIWASRGILYAFFRGRMSMLRTLLVLAAPFFVMSLLPIMIAAIFAPPHRAIVVLSLGNGVVSGLDIALFLRLLPYCLQWQDVDWCSSGFFGATKKC